MRVLLLSPHTDDVELGAGGTLLKLKEQGHDLRWLVFSAAEESLPRDMPETTLCEEFARVADAAGIAETHRRVLLYRVRHLHQYRQGVLDAMLKERGAFNPDLVIGPSLHDVHQDHHVVANEMLRAFKASASIICYELPWNHVKFDTQLFVSLDEQHVTRKVDLLACYESQRAIGRPYFDPEYVRGLARARGVQCGSKYAEAFEVLRWRL